MNQSTDLTPDYRLELTDDVLPAKFTTSDSAENQPKKLRFKENNRNNTQDSQRETQLEISDSDSMHLPEDDADSDPEVPSVTDQLGYLI